MARVMAVAVLFAALLASAAAVKISVSPTSMTIEKGFKRVIEFRLDEPIICAIQGDRECAVVVKITNTHPNSVAIDNCHVKWTVGQWYTPRYVTVRAVENFIDDKEMTFMLVTEPAVSGSAYYSNFNPEDITLRTKPRPSAICSATGDPHYVSFDKHPFHIYAPGRVVFYKSTNPDRDFEVQTDMYSFNRPAVHCAIAARENNDIVVISLCGDGHTIQYRRSCGSSTCRNGGFPKVGITSGSNPRYVIDFASGAQITAQIAFWEVIGKRYINVYATAPGADYAQTQGVCGNNDGNAKNDINVGHDAWIHDLSVLYESQRPKVNLFTWYPSSNEPPAPTLPPFAEECPFIDRPIIRQILNHPDVEDITNLLKQALPRAVEDAEGLDFTDDSGVILPPRISFEEAAVLCERIRLTQVAKACLFVFPNFDIDTFLQGCAEDMAETGGDLDFLSIAVDALENECADEGNRNQDTWETDNNGNPIEPNLGLQNAMCPNGCSGNGVCTATKCECVAPFSGLDCSINKNLPPTVERTNRALCDARHLLDCSERVSVIGRNFHHSDQLACRFNGNTVTTAHYLGAMEVYCDVPEFRHTGATQHTVTVEVTTDGVTWSAIAPAATFTWYDSVCQICLTGGNCRANPESCTIDGACYLHMQSHPDNICRICDPDQSASAWSFDKGHDHECGPVFDLSSYTTRIVSQAVAGAPLITVRARNPLVADDADSAVTYSIVHNVDDESGRFNIDPVTGVVSPKATIVVNNALLHTWHALMHVVATDKSGRRATANLYVEIWETNDGPQFEEASYNFGIDENVAVGSVVGTVKATSAGEATFGAITYRWLQQQDGHLNAWVINAQTGVITAGVSPDFEALSLPSPGTFQLMAMAQDGGGQYHTVPVTIQVRDVNEAPTGVTLTPSTVREDAAVGTVIGRLDGVDQDANEVFNFALLGGDLALVELVGADIRTKAALDFETLPVLSLQVRVTDKGGLTFVGTVVIAVEDVNEPPRDITLSQTSFAENVRGAIATLSVIDDDVNDVVVCTLTFTDQGRFELTSSHPQQLVLLVPFNYEESHTHNIEVGCEDLGGLVTRQAFALTVTDVAEAPENFVLAQAQPLPEDAVGGVVVGTLSVDDHDAGVTSIAVSIVPGSDGAHNFVLGPVSCTSLTGILRNPILRCTTTVSVASGATLDFDTQPEAPLMVMATNNLGLTAYADLAVVLSNVNEAPRGLAWITGGSVEENSPVNTIVGQLGVDDPDHGDTFTFTLLQGQEAFGIRAGLPEERRRDSAASFATVYVVDGSKIDFETSGGSIELIVDVEDAGGLRASLSVTVTVTDEPMAVVFSVDMTHYASVSEDASVGTVVGSLAVRGLDIAGAVPVYTLLSTAVPFTVVGNELRVSGALDFETRPFFLLVVGVSFTGASVPAFEDKVTISVIDVDEPPVFVGAPSSLRVSHDLGRGTTIVTLTALDPEGEAVTLTLLRDDTNLLELTAAGALRLTAMPSGAGLDTGSYTVQVRARSVSNNDDDTILTLTLILVDDCDGEPCNGKGQCTDVGISSFSCNCNKGFTGPRCESVEIILASNAAMSAGASAGVIVGVLCAVLLLAVVVVVVVRRRRAERDTKAILAWSHAEEGVFDNPTFVAPAEYASVDFVPGVSNPMYEWYRPDMTRQDATDALMAGGEGSFVVRDSKATPGWHMLDVRTLDSVVHEKIRMTEDRMYELLPSSSRQQPAFTDLPSLVQYYGSPRPDVAYVLSVSSFDNPMYAMGLTGESGHYHTNWHRDVEAPVVPLKERELDAVALVATAENDIYTNTSEAQAAMRRSSTSA